jgi:hypothetical protein
LRQTLLHEMHESPQGQPFVHTLQQLRAGSTLLGDSDEEVSSESSQPALGDVSGCVEAGATLCSDGDCIG